MTDSVVRPGVRAAPANLAEVRCRDCGKMLFRWLPGGVMNIEVKCFRCGRIDTLRLSTA